MPAAKVRSARRGRTNEALEEAVPVVRESNPVVAVLVADLHLSHKPPLFRSGEPDWFAAMKRSLDALKALTQDGQLPVVCAGDVFDRWNSPPELVNFALAELPVMYAVPGQHDLPYHRYDDIHKSAYWTLVKAEKIIDLPPDKPKLVEKGVVPLALHGFPYGFDPKPLDAVPAQGCCLDLAVVHRHLWTPATRYHEAPERYNVKRIVKRLRGYDAAVFGDNHKGFLVRAAKKCHVLNCGGFMVRNSDQADYQPCVGLLHADGSIRRQPLVVEQSILGEIASRSSKKGDGFEAERFFKDLRDLAVDATIDFITAVKAYLDIGQVPDAVIDLVLRSLDEARSKGES